LRIVFRLKTFSPNAPSLAAPQQVVQVHAVDVVIVSSQCRRRVRAAAKAVEDYIRRMPGAPVRVAGGRLLRVRLQLVET
jgi:hypothetical protein